MNKPLKILMLEDSDADAEILQEFLLREKPDSIFKVVMNEPDFLAALKQFEPHLVLSDNTMPQFSGTEALNLFKEKNLPIPFILVTGTVSEEFAAGIIKAGADDYILKDRLTRLPGAIDGAMEKKRIEAEKRKAEEMIRFKADLLNSVAQSVIATDINGIVQYWNRAAENIYGFSNAEALGKNVLDLTPAGETIENSKQIMRQLSEGKSWSGEFLVKRKDGSSFPAFVTNSPFYDKEGSLAGIIGVSYDLTAQKEAEATLRAMEKRIAEQQIKEQKKISRAIIKAQEKEKNHIGKELHDNINQILAGAKMFMKIAAKKSAEIKALLDYPIELINNSIEEIRLLTYKQVTPLKNIDLDGQVRKLMETLNRGATQRLHFNSNLQEESLSDDLKLNIYRILQEQVNNVLKHADASNINISVMKNGQCIYLTVEDDGKGFDPREERKGIGLSNITNRVEAFDGKVEIQSSPGKGTTLSATIPC